jgi:hypothetical protein
VRDLAFLAKIIKNELFIFRRLRGLEVLPIKDSLVTQLVEKTIYITKVSA